MSALPSCCAARRAALRIIICSERSGSKGSAELAPRSVRLEEGFRCGRACSMGCIPSGGASALTSLRGAAPCRARAAALRAVRERCSHTHAGGQRALVWPGCGRPQPAQQHLKTKPMIAPDPRRRSMQAMPTRGPSCPGPSMSAKAVARHLWHAEARERSGVLAPAPRLRLAPRGGRLVHRRQPRGVCGLHRARAGRLRARLRARSHQRPLLHANETSGGQTLAPKRK